MVCGTAYAKSHRPSGGQNDIGGNPVYFTDATSIIAPYSSLTLGGLDGTGGVLILKGSNSGEQRLTTSPNGGAMVVLPAGNPGNPHDHVETDGASHWSYTADIRIQRVDVANLPVCDGSQDSRVLIVDNASFCELGAPPVAGGSLLCGVTCFNGAWAHY